MGRLGHTSLQKVVCLPPPPVATLWICELVIHFFHISFSFIGDTSSPLSHGQRLNSVLGLCQHCIESLLSLPLPTSADAILIKIMEKSGHCQIVVPTWLQWDVTGEWVALQASLCSSCLNDRIKAYQVYTQEREGNLVFCSCLHGVWEKMTLLCSKICYTIAWCETLAEQALFGS